MKTSKNSVVCTIAAKLAKHGVKNPMRVAWQVYRIAMNCLHSIAKKCHYDFFSYAFDLEYTIMAMGILPSQILPASVLTMFAKAGLALA